MGQQAEVPKMCVLSRMGVFEVCVQLPWLVHAWNVGSPLPSALAHATGRMRNYEATFYVESCRHVNSKLCAGSGLCCSALRGSLWNHLRLDQCLLSLLVAQLARKSRAAELSEALCAALLPRVVIGHRLTGWGRNLRQMCSFARLRAAPDSESTNSGWEPMASCPLGTAYPAGMP